MALFLIVETAPSARELILRRRTTWLIWTLIHRGNSKNARIFELLKVKELTWVIVRIKEVFWFYNSSNYIFCPLGVCTKDDQQQQNGSSENGVDIRKDNGSMGSSNSSDVRCLKLRLRSKFRSAAAQGCRISENRKGLSITCLLGVCMNHWIYIDRRLVWRISKHYFFKDFEIPSLDSRYGSK